MTIVAQPGAPLEPILTKAPAGLAGQLGFQIMNPETGEVMTPRREAGITEPSPGTYWTTATAPFVEDLYLIIWDYVDPDSGKETAPTEELRVTSSAIISPVEP